MSELSAELWFSLTVCIRGYQAFHREARVVHREKSDARYGEEWAEDVRVPPPPEAPQVDNTAMSGLNTNHKLKELQDFSPLIFFLCDSMAWPSHVDFEDEV